ncbi:hypothetical protein Slin14017_G021770 [Septoria linicola]|nr:hypothetical protein Slin14017_G021770 [Septoria linicola]
MPRYFSADEMALAARVWDAERSFELEWQFYPFPHERNKRPALDLSTQLPMHERPQTPPLKSMMSPLASPFTPRTTPMPPEIRLQDEDGEQCGILFSPQSTVVAQPPTTLWPEPQPVVGHDIHMNRLSNLDDANEQRCAEGNTSSQRLDHMEIRTGVMEHRLLPLEQSVRQLGLIVRQHGSVLWNYAQYENARQGHEERHLMPAQREYGQPAGGNIVHSDHSHTHNHHQERQHNDDQHTFRDDLAPPTRGVHPPPSRHHLHEPLPGAPLHQETLSRQRLHHRREIIRLTEMCHEELAIHNGRGGMTITLQDGTTLEELADHASMQLRLH